MDVVQVEERCQLVRLALKIAGLPTRADAERLEDWLSGCLQARRGAVDRALTCFGEGRSARVTYGSGDSDQLEKDRVHECGHVLLGPGMGAYMRALGESGGLADLNDRIDEGLLKKWELAWYLPADVLRRMDWRDVMEESRLDWNAIRERYDQLRRMPRVELDGPPWWAAAHKYQIRVRHDPTILQLYYGEDKAPEFQIQTDPNYREAAFQIQADLCALRESEFRLKYASEARRLGRPLHIDFPALREWAGLHNRPRL